MDTWLFGRACGVLAIEMTEIALENHTWAGTRTYDYLRVLLKYQMTSKVFGVGIYMYVDIPSHVFTLMAFKKDFDNDLQLYLCFFFLLFPFSCPDCIKEKTYAISENILIKLCSKVYKICDQICINKHLSPLKSFQMTYALDELFDVQDNKDHAEECVLTLACKELYQYIAQVDRTALEHTM